MEKTGNSYFLWSVRLLLFKIMAGYSSDQSCEQTVFTCIIYLMRLLFILLLGVATSAYQLLQNILILHQQDFPIIFDQYPYLLVMFYAPWCGRSKKLASIFKDLAVDLKERHSVVKIGKLDATVQTRTAIMYNIHRYPTLQLFVESKSIEYAGQFTKEDILKWLERKLMPPITTIYSQRQLSRLTFKDYTSVVYLGNSLPQIEWFKNLALMDDYNNYYILSESLLPENHTNHVQIHRNFDAVAYYNDTNFDLLQEWIQRNSRSVILEFQTKTIRTIFAEYVPALVYFNSGYSKEVHRVVAEFGRGYQGNLIFTEISPENQYFHKFADYINMNAHESHLIIILAESKQKIIYRGNIIKITLSQLTQFVHDYETGQSKRLGLFDLVVPTVTEL